MIKKTLSLILIFISLLLGFHIATAQDPILKLQQQDVEAGLKDTEFLACFQGWRQFVSSVIGWQGFSDYWKELIEFNICYRTDLDLVRQQVDKARRMVRSTFLRCDLKNLGRFTKSYYKLEAELFFLHHMFDKIDRISNPTILRGLVKEMKDFFVLEKGFLTEELLQEYVEEFAAKYRPRVIAYNRCRSDYYEEFSAKIAELVQNFKDFGEVFQGETDREKKRREERERLQKESGFDPNSENPRKGPILSIGEDFDLNLKIARLKVEPERSFADLKEEILGQPGTTNKSMGLRLDQAPSFVDSEKQRVFEESSKAEMEARYELLYAQMSDGGVAEMKASIDKLISTVQTSIPHMKLVEQCIDEVEERECKNK